MMAIFERNCSKLSKLVSISSINISPSTSAIRNRDPINEDFPACLKIELKYFFSSSRQLNLTPVLPTIPIFSPFEIEKFTSFKAAGSVFFE